LPDHGLVADLTLADVDEIQRFLLTTREDVLTWLPNPWEPGWKAEAADELRNAETGRAGRGVRDQSAPPMPPQACSCSQRSTASKRWRTR